MTKSSTFLATTLACALGAAACTSSSNNNPGTGGSGTPTGGAGTPTGGSIGSATGGAGGSATGGAGGAGGAATGGSSGSDAGTSRDSGSGGTTSDGAATSSDGAGTSTGAFMITVDNAGMMGNRLCFKPEASHSQGDKSPAIMWTDPPAGTKSFALTMEDQTGNPTPHQIVTDIPATERMRPPDVKAMLPTGASMCFGHGNKMAWYGPGAGAVHQYEITIWALAVDKFPLPCMGDGGTTARPVLNMLKAKKGDTSLVLGSSSKVLWGNVMGQCM